jgi:hypothetical protein
VYRAPPGAIQPDYKLTSDIESPASVEQLLDATLDTKITITNRQLLAASPELRKRLRELISVKRIPTDGQVAGVTIEAEPALAAEYAMLQGSEGPSVAQRGMSLRMVDAEIGPEGRTVKVGCLLDTGCEIVVMREDVWMQLGWPLRPDMQIRMEDASTGANWTLGALVDVPFNIHGVLVHLQVQVVKNLPVPILLGRPFQAIVSCITYDYPNGSQAIAIHDPRSGERTIVPTYDRKISKLAAAGSGKALSGF